MVSHSWTKSLRTSLLFSRLYVGLFPGCCVESHIIVCAAATFTTGMIIDAWIIILSPSQEINANAQYFFKMTMQQVVSLLDIFTKTANLFGPLSIFIAQQRSCGRTMFSVVSLCHSVHRWDVCDHYPWYIGYHCIGPLPVLAPTLPTSDLGPLPPAPDPRSWTSDIGPSDSDIWWWSLETWSNVFIWGPPGVTSCDSYWNWSTYSFQAGSAHPTTHLRHFFGNPAVTQGNRHHRISIGSSLELPMWHTDRFWAILFDKVVDSRRNLNFKLTGHVD